MIGGRGFGVYVGNSTLTSKSLAALSSGFLKIVDKPMREWSDRLFRSQIFGRENYAPERPGQTYVRTGKLGSEHSLTHPRLATAVFRNTTDYAPFVIGDSEGKRQAWMHRGRWWVEREVIEAAVPELIDMAEKELADYVRKFS